MIKGIGCDMVDISRIERLVRQSRFIQKVYTPYEQELVSDKSAHTAAGIWAAKEAVSKALGTGFAGFKIRDIEIRTNENGKPYVRLYEGAQRILSALGGEQIHLSISHERNQALAFTVIE